MTASDRAHRIDVTGDEMSAAFLDDDGALTGLIAVGRADDLDAARPLVLEHARLSAAALADAGRPLAECRSDAPAVAR